MMEHAAADNRPVTYRDVFRNGNWIRLWTGQTISQFGDAISDIAFPLLVYQVTHKSAVALGFGFAIELLPLALIGPVAGVFVDRWNRRTVLLVGDFVRILCAMGLFFSSSLWQLYLLALIAAIMQATFLPAYSAVIPQITGHQYVKSISLSYTGYRIMQVLGPAVAGGLMALFAGPRPVFLVDAATFAAAVLMTLTIRVSDVVRQEQRPHFFADLRVGLSFLGRSAVVRYIAGYNVILTIALAASTLGAVIYIKSALGLSASASNQLYAWAVAVLGGTVALATWIIGYLDNRLPKRPMILWGPVLMGIAYLLFALHPGPSLILPLFFIVSIGNACALVPVLAYLATAIPNELRGRVYSFTNAMDAVAQLVAFSAFGALALQLPPAGLLIISGILLAAGAPLCALVLHGSHALRAHDEAQERAATSSSASSLSPAAR
jgi:DHA3 family macrolide efflux protein-like MFS transporter